MQGQRRVGEASDVDLLSGSADICKSHQTRARGKEEMRVSATVSCGWYKTETQVCPFSGSPAHQSGQEVRTVPPELSGLEAQLLCAKASITLREDTHLHSSRQL